MAFGTELLPWALAAGLGIAICVAPWFALVALGLAALLPVIPTPPGDLAAFASPWISGPAVALAVTGLLVMGHPTGRAAWELLHVPVRVILPGLVVLLALVGGEAGPSPDLTFGAPTVRGALLLCLALSVSLLLLGWGSAILSGLQGVRAFHEGRGGALALEMGGAGLALATVAQPLLAAPLAVAAVGAAALRQRRAFRVAPLSPALLRGLAASLGGGAGWRGPDTLPHWVHPGTRSRDRESSTLLLRGTPAVLLLKAGAENSSESPMDGPYDVRAGWLTLEDGGPRFLFRSPIRIWEVPLKEARPVEGSERCSSLIQGLELSDGGTRMILGTSRGGPTLREIQSEFVRDL